MKILLLTILFFLAGCSDLKNEKPAHLTEKIFYPSKNILGFENIFNSNLSYVNIYENF